MPRYVHTPSGVQTELTYAIGVGLGLIPAHQRVTALGHNPNIPLAGGAADVWEGGGDYPFLSAASQLEVVSTSANDAAAGTGARTVLVSGVDANYVPISETVTLNGLTPVTTIRNYLSVNTFTITSSGTGTINAGDLTLRVAGGGTIQSIARAGVGFGNSAVYTVPAGNTLFIISEVFTVLPSDPKTNAGATFGAQLISANGTKRIPLQFQVLSTAPYRHDIVLGIILTEKSRVTLRVTSSGQINTNVTAAFEAILVSNAALL